MTDEEILARAAKADVKVARHVPTEEELAEAERLIAAERDGEDRSGD